MSINHPIKQLIDTVKNSDLDTVVKELIPEKLELVTLGPNREVLPHKSGIWKKRKIPKGEHYLVSMEEESSPIQTTLTLEHEKLIYNLKLKLDYTLLCPTSSIEQFVQALAGKKPYKQWDEWLEQQVHNFESDLRKTSNSLLISFPSQKKRLIKKLTELAEKEIGVELNLDIKTPEVDKVGSARMVPYQWDSKPIRLKDFDYDIKVGGNTELKIISEQRFKANAIQFQSTKVQGFFYDALKKVLRQASLNEFLTEYLTENPSILIEELNRKLHHIGRYITRITLIPENKLQRLLKEFTKSRNLTHKISDLSGRHAINIEVIYKAITLAGQEEFAFRKLFRPDPSTNLDQFIHRSVDRFQKKTDKEEKDLIIDFYDLKDQLIHFIADAGREKLGVELDLHIDIKGNPYVEPSSISEGNIGILVKDYNQEITVAIEAHLEADPENEIRAQSSTLNRDLEKRLVLRGLRTSIFDMTLHELVLKPNEVGEYVKRELNPQLTRFGRKLIQIRITPITTFDFHNDYKIEPKPVELKIPGRNEIVTVKNTLMVYLDDLGTYYQNYRSDFGGWLKSVITRNVESVLIEKDYVDLIDKRHIYEGKIKTKIVDEIEASGYKVTQHLVVSNLPHLDLKSPFQIEDNSDFVTQLPKVSVKLKIIIRGRISDLEQIKRYLVRAEFTVDRIKDEIKIAAHNEVAKILEDIEPKHFFEYFNQPFKNSLDGRTLQEILLDALYDRLLRADEDRAFGFHDDLDIKVLPQDNNLMERYRDLRQIQRVMIVDVSSLAKYQQGTVARYKLRYSIKGVNRNRWEVFMDKSTLPIESQLKELEDYFTEFLLETLETFDPKELQYEGFEDKELIKKDFIKPVAKQVGEEVGLKMEILSFRRIASNFDQEVIKLNQTAMKNKINVDLQLELAEQAEQMAAVTAINEQIRNLSSLHGFRDTKEIKDLKARKEKLLNQGGRFVQLPKGKSKKKKKTSQKKLSMREVASSLKLTSSSKTNKKKSQNKK